MGREHSRPILFSAFSSSMLIDRAEPGRFFCSPNTYDPKSCTSDIFFVFAHRLNLSMYPFQGPNTRWEFSPRELLLRAIHAKGIPIFCRDIKRRTSGLAS
jgi:hypothetical protein